MSYKTVHCHDFTDYRTGPGHSSAGCGNQCKGNGMDDGYLQYAEGPLCTGVVTGKPLEIGGALGRKDATGRGVMFTALNVLEVLRMGRGKPRLRSRVLEMWGNHG